MSDEQHDQSVNPFAVPVEPSTPLTPAPTSDQLVAPAPAVDPTEAVLATDTIPGPEASDSEEALFAMPTPPPAPPFIPVQMPIPVPPVENGLRHTVRKVIISLAVIGVLSVGLGVAGGLADNRGSGPVTGQAISLPYDSNTLEPGRITKIAEEVSASVVQIKVAGGTGSGFVVAGGYIITNAHVTDAASGTITIEFADGESAEGTLVGASRDYDIAVIKVSRSDIKPLTLGDSDNVRVGDSVLAAGSPLGLQGTVTMGIISALDRPVTAGDGITGETTVLRALQTDAAINPGNSGGPLVDVAGRVIGVNSAIATAPGATAATAGSIGLGFAIPINKARAIAEQLIANGKAETPRIGIMLDTAYTGKGAKVQTVVPDSPAAKAELQPGDIIERIDGTVVRDSVALVLEVRDRVVGDTIKLTVDRAGKDVVLSVTLDASVATPAPLPSPSPSE